MSQGFGFGPEFAPKLRFIRAGCDRMLKTTTISWLCRRTLQRRLEFAVVSGDPREVETALRTLDGRAWRWPWMEDWAVQFGSVRVWPDNWTKRGILAPLQWQALPDSSKQSLLADTIQTAIYVERDAENLCDPSTAMVFHPSLRADDGCEASKIVTEKHQNSIRRRDLSQLPPYFPGDPTSIERILNRRHSAPEGLPL